MIQASTKGTDMIPMPTKIHSGYHERPKGPVLPPMRFSRKLTRGTTSRIVQRAPRLRRTRCTQKLHSEKHRLVPQSPLEGKRRLSQQLQRKKIERTTQRKMQNVKKNRGSPVYLLKILQLGMPRLLTEEFDFIHAVMMERTVLSFFPRTPSLHSSKELEK